MVSFWYVARGETTGWNGRGVQIESSVSTGKSRRQITVMNPGRSQAARTRTCVIVDDVRAYRLQVKWWLDELGFRSIEASDAGQAFELIRMQHPDLLVTDIDMPGHSGLDLVRAVRDDLDAPYSEMPVLVISSLEDDSIGSIVRACRANAFLSKPLSRDDLSVVIERLGRLPASQDGLIATIEPVIQTPPETVHLQDHQDSSPSQSSAAERISPRLRRLADRSQNPTDGFGNTS